MERGAGFCSSRPNIPCIPWVVVAPWECSDGSCLLDACWRCCWTEIKALPAFPSHPPRKSRFWDEIKGNVPWPRGSWDLRQGWWRNPPGCGSGRAGPAPPLRSRRWHPDTAGHGGVAPALPCAGTPAQRAGRSPSWAAGLEFGHGKSLEFISGAPGQAGL